MQQKLPILNVLWLDDAAFPLTLSLLLPALTRGRTWANMWQRKASATSVFILQLKPTGYIYPGQTCPAQRRVKSKKKVIA